MTGRDANRGECAQPCRWEYHLVEAQRPGEVYSLVQEEKGAYFFNSNDLRMIDAIPQMMDAGIKSLKIEGRAKSAYYVACVTAAYRRAIDFAWEHPGEPLPAAILAETEKISHRPYSHGFYFGGEPGQTLDRSHYARGYEWTAATTPGATSWWPCARAGRTAWSPCGSATGFSRARRWISSSRGESPSPPRWTSCTTRTARPSRWLPTRRWWSAGKQTCLWRRGLTCGSRKRREASKARGRAGQVAAQCLGTQVAHAA